MKVSDVMTEAVIADVEEDTLADAAAKMREQQTGSLLVMEGDRLVGIYTERDLLKAIAQGHDPGVTQLRAEMTRNVMTVTPDTGLSEAAQLMASRWIRHLPVVEAGKVVGVISQRDIMGVASQVLEAVERPPQELARARRLRRIEAGDLD